MGLLAAHNILMVDRVEYYSEFLLKRQREIEEKRRERLKHKKIKKLENHAKPTPRDDFYYEKKMTNDEIVEKGEIIRVKDSTLSADDFRVEISY